MKCKDGLFFSPTSSTKIRRKSLEKNNHEREAQGETKRERKVSQPKGAGLREGR